MDNIKHIIINTAEEFGVDLSNIDENQSLIETGVMDSMAFVNILLELEDQLNIEIDFENVQIDKITSINGLLTHIATLKEL